MKINPGFFKKIFIFLIGVCVYYAIYIYLMPFIFHMANNSLGYGLGILDTIMLLLFMVLVVPLLLPFELIITTLVETLFQSGINDQVVVFARLVYLFLLAVFSYFLYERKLYENRKYKVKER